MAARKLSPTKFVQVVYKDFMKESGLEPRLFGPSLRITHASAGKVNFEIDVAQQHTNRLKIMHGGTIASMVDLGGSLAVASHGLFNTGVSTDINVTYLSSGGAIGQTLKASAICDRIGKTLAYTTVTFHNEKGEVAARGSHTKFVAKTWGKHEPYVAVVDNAEDGKDQ